MSRTTYADLFAALGTLYGSGNGVNTFHLPDLRGEFIRGWDKCRGVDTSRVMGGTQTDAFQGHQHRIVYSYGSGNENGVSVGSAPYYGGYTRNQQEQSIGAYENGTNGTPRTAAETRPRNIALLACIKY